MRLRTGLLLASAAALLPAAPAMAGHHQATGWYSSLQAGVNVIEDESIKGSGLVCGLGFCVWTDANPYGGIEFDQGLAAAGAVGYAWGSNWNIEFELAYRENDIECLTGALVPCGAYKAGFADPGSVWQFSQFVNLRYDIPVGDRFYVGVGAGVGGTLISMDDEAGFHDDDYVLSGQLIGQLGYNIAKRWDVYLDYRYMVTDEPEFLNLNYIGGLLNTSSYDVSNHSVMLGVRLDLQEDCEEPKPTKKVDREPPPPAPPQEFIVFFGFNKSNLTADAQKVVAEAAAAAAQLNADKVVVVGHADTVGSPRYNMELSERRAETVRAELVRQGVKADRIATSGRGEGDLMVQTGDNVREPQNRRASITIMIKAASH